MLKSSLGQRRDRYEIARKQTTEERPQLTLAQFQQLSTTVYSEDKINESFQVHTWNSQFTNQIVNTQHLDSAFLLDNQRFKDLKQMIQLYNQEVIEAFKNKTYIRNQAWRSVFFKKLLSLLREALQSNNRDIQIQQIDKIYFWATSQLKQLDYQANTRDRPKKNAANVLNKDSSITKDKSMVLEQNNSMAAETMAETINVSLEQSRADSPDHLVDGSTIVIHGDPNQSYDDSRAKTVQPSQQIKNELQDYSTHSRTVHFGFDPPKSRLQTYQRRLLSSVDMSQRNNTSIVKKQKSAFTPYNQIVVRLPNTIQTTLNKSTNSEQDEAAEIAQQVQQDLKQNQKSEKIVVAPLIKTYKTDRQEDVDTHQPFETKSTYQSYVPSQDLAELALNRMYIKNRMKEAKQNRQDEELIHMMKDWAKTKGRMEKEINRRYQSCHDGSFYNSLNEQIGGKHAQMNEKIFFDELQRKKDPIKQIIVNDKDLQQQISPKSQAKINKFKTVDYEQRLQADTIVQSLDARQIQNARVSRLTQHHKDILGISDSVQQESDNKQHGSLSVYNQIASANHKRYSSSLDTFNNEVIRQEQFKEIAEIKTRMAKHRIVQPVMKLMNALLVPTQKINDVPLPDIGAGYLEYNIEKNPKKNGRRR